MKELKVMVALVVGIGLFTAKPPLAFHGEGGGACEGCHAMHSTTSERPNGSAALLRQSDSTAVCLSCHMASMGTPASHGIHIATAASDMPAGWPPAHLSPAGDFGWLKKDYRWRNRSGEEMRSEGDRHGHNIVSGRFGLLADRRNVTAPLGSYPAPFLTCISCHDPHCGYGNYRLLGGRGYQPKHLTGSFSFTADAPVALALANKGGEQMVVYGSGFSEWCGNCHGTDGSSAMKHPAGALARLSSEIIANYNRYVSTGNLSGDAATSYTSLVPIELGISDAGTLSRLSEKQNVLSAAGSANVMCLTCHRAHASGWDGMTRWNTKSEYLVYNGLFPGIDNGTPEEYAQGRTAAETRRAYYDRMPTAFAAFQRSLCNKCHVKD